MTNRLCKNCKTSLVQKIGEGVAHYRRRKFCGQQCYLTYMKTHPTTMTKRFHLDEAEVNAKWRENNLPAIRRSLIQRWDNPDYRLHMSKVLSNHAKIHSYFVTHKDEMQAHRFKVKERGNTTSHRLTDDDIRSIASDARNCKEIATSFNSSPSFIASIKRGDIYASITQSVQIHRKPRGKAPNLSDDQIREIRVDPRHNTEIAAAYDIKANLVGEIKAGRKYSRVKESPVVKPPKYRPPAPIGGKRHTFYNLTPEQIEAIRKDVRFQHEIARAYNLDRDDVAFIQKDFRRRTTKGTLTDDQVRAIRKDERKHKIIANAYSTSIKVIRSIKYRERYASVPN